MKDVSTLFLKMVVIVLSLPMILCCMFLIPEIVQATADLSAEFNDVPGVIFVGLIVPFASMANVSILKNGNATAVKFSTLKAICKALDCRPCDSVAYEKITTAICEQCKVFQHVFSNKV